ncbi:DUF2612 domain-containing protein [Phaeovibrio sulfidiphilus]|uniref:DUF2612 domain-containing protein n=1 Tax=Phaeovibrio sulfidiphilus TaxID=1220600 RepID=A0A8J6YW26_9PROT|nr:DUF2612 domain-containing protein [Phaeovibrio sulfidiphilus]MBE1237499.1 DUF2612 domain-containing protein [Phaeovibrio sulfidiphilus]
MNIRSIPNLRSVPDIRDVPPATLQSQYSASPVIRSLVAGKAARLDPANDILLFYRTVFDIRTARGPGLDIWGRILGISRSLELDEGDVLGFNGSGLRAFDNGVFNPGAATRTFALADAPFRELLMFKALANISSADAATLNALLNRLFRGLPVFVLEVGVMRIRCVFPFLLEPWQRSLFRKGGLLARGAGVGFEWLEHEPGSTFGFSGSGLQPFDQGAFSYGVAIPEPPAE